MTTFNSLSDLDAALNAAISVAMSTTITEAVTDIMVQNIDVSVMSYDPREYERRSVGGINDRNNIVGETSNSDRAHNLVVRNVAMPNASVITGDNSTWDGSYSLADVVENGTLGPNNVPAQLRMPPRPFIQPTQDYIDSHPNIITDAIMSQFKK